MDKKDEQTVETPKQKLMKLLIFYIQGHIIIGITMKHLGILNLIH